MSIQNFKVSDEFLKNEWKLIIFILLMLIFIIIVCLLILPRTMTSYLFDLSSLLTFRKGHVSKNV